MSPESQFTDQFGQSFKSLPDFLQHGLSILSIGLNPSINSVKAGFYFATPTNRFWKALNQSELVSEPISPGLDGHSALLREFGMGFTDVVKRPTPGASDLRAADFRYWAPVLEQKLLNLKPRVAWFHGKVAYSRFLKMTGRSDEDIVWGAQDLQIGQSKIFVSPNPSAANAAFSLDVLTEAYNELSHYYNE
ncbi:MAG: mismatch-specific DNA-glycosylase [Gammaproteobacteria bacterium]|nr:mismatch-specific DNA-glycosylase [Gammaproteobacteria bacterium]